eukprot:1229563-Pyramimonas_sp.AAC.1
MVVDDAVLVEAQAREGITSRLPTWLSHVRPQPWARNVVTGVARVLGLQVLVASEQAVLLVGVDVHAV